ncbi:MAG: hypothetical protein L3J36_07430 [Rhodobacteraceae bacterium]|nr:hypothetical protein [Paracoccaceae bacterium]
MPSLNAFLECLAEPFGIVADGDNVGGIGQYPEKDRAQGIPRFIDAAADGNFGVGTDL